MKPGPDFDIAAAVADRSIRGFDHPACAPRRIAAHSSGHAVIALLQDIRVNRITLKTDHKDGWLGQVEWSHPSLGPFGACRSRRGRRKAYQQALRAYLGGRGAELLEGYGWPGDTFTLDYAAPDTEKVLALAELIAPHSPWRIVRGSLNHVRDLILDPVIACGIGSLTRALLAERVLSGEQVELIVRGALTKATCETCVPSLG